MTSRLRELRFEFDALRELLRGTSEFGEKLLLMQAMCDLIEEVNIEVLQSSIHMNELRMWLRL